MSREVQNLNLEGYVGYPFTWYIPLTDDGVDYNPSSDAFVMTVKGFNGTVYLAPTITIGDYNGSPALQIDISDTDMATIDEGIYKYDIRMTPATGNRRPIVEGRFYVYETATAA